MCTPFFRVRGATYVPLNPAYPKERLAFMVEATSMRWLLLEERLLGSLPEMAAATVGGRASLS